jgi:hypothetical protein
MADSTGTTTPDTSSILSLGLTADGRSSVLNLDTGAVELRGHENPGNRLIHRRDFDSALVASIFHGAGYGVEILNSGTVAVSDNDCRTCVDVLPNLGQVRMRRYFGFYEGVSDSVRHQCTNAMNQVLCTGRAFCDRDGDLILEAELLFGAGLSSAQLLAGYRFFDTEVQEAIALDETEDVVE